MEEGAGRAERGRGAGEERKCYVAAFSDVWSCCCCVYRISPLYNEMCLALDRTAQATRKKLGGGRKTSAAWWEEEEDECRG